MNFDLIYVDLDCTTPFIVRIRTDNQADAINTRISRGNITFDAAFEILSLLFYDLGSHKFSFLFSILGICLRYHEVPCGSRHVQ